MNVDLFLRKVPDVVRELIGRQAAENRRSLNQEAIALLEEALVSRIEGASSRRTRLDALRRFVDSQAAGLDGPSVASLPSMASAVAPLVGELRPLDPQPPV